MTNDDSIRYHSTQVWVHLSELIDCTLPKLSNESRQAIEAVLAITERLSKEFKCVWCRQTTSIEFDIGPLCDQCVLQCISCAIGHAVEENPKRFLDREFPLKKGDDNAR